MSKQYIFLAGLPRSGSTLFTSILNQNPDIFASSSSPVCNTLYWSHRLWSDQIALQANPNADVPLPLLFTARLLEGASPTRSYINTIQRMEELGIPTGPMPDGSPNEFLAAISAVIEGMDKENAENGKSVVAVGPLTVTPLFTTVPQKAYGKSF